MPTNSAALEMASPVFWSAWIPLKVAAVSNKTFKRSSFLDTKFAKGSTIPTIDCAIP